MIDLSAYTPIANVIVIVAAWKIAERFGQRLYTKDEVQAVIATVMEESTRGTMEWVENETRILDKTTKQPIPNCESCLVENPKRVTEYIWRRLANHGIKYEDNKPKQWISSITQ